jgi:predicted enzyme related to lactoylglutathione lyase
MAREYGQFCWYELVTPDPASAESFYKKVVGWTTAKPMGPDYTVIEADGAGVGGVMALTDEMSAMGVPPCWTGYIMVEDLDDAVARLQKLGGSIRRPPAEIPNVGRFAVAADPQGAVFCLFQDTTNANPPAVDPNGQGQCGWRELMAGDGEKALAFYCEMFGWTKDADHDMGPMGVYHLFAINGKQAGGMMTKPENCPAPYWGYYYNVDGAEAAASRLTAAGGKVLMGPMEVPGGQWIVQAQDPQGAHFAVVAPKK